MHIKFQTKRKLIKNIRYLAKKQVALRLTMFIMAILWLLVKKGLPKYNKNKKYIDRNIVYICVTAVLKHNIIIMIIL